MMHHLNRILVLCTILAGIGGVFLTVFSVSTPVDAAPSTCRELEIVFVIDQSGSMGGPETAGVGRTIANDPLKLRFYAPQHAIETMGPLRYTAHPDSTIRFALIHFGDRPEIGIPWTVITPTNEIEWKRQLADLHVVLDKQKAEWEKRNLGGTNFLRAFQGAASLFSQRPAQVGDCPYRAVVLLTDGKPESAEPGFTVAKHFAELQDYVSKFMPIPNYDLYVVATSQDAHWEETESYWLKIAGDPKKIGLVRNENEIGQRFNNILNNLANRLPGVPGIMTDVCSPGEVLIEPYLQSVAFTLYKTTNQPDHLRVEDEKGVVEPNRKDITVTVEGFDTPIETIRVLNPMPGLWRLKTTLPGQRCDIKKLSITAAGRLLKPTPADRLLQFTRTSISFQIADSGGNPLPDYGGAYALDVQARVTDVSGVEDLATSAGEKNVFNASYIPIEAGTHTVEVLATTQDATGKEITIINQAIASFQVDPVKLALLEGPGKEALPQHLPISITLAFVDPNKKPVRPALQTTLAVTITRDTQTTPVVLSPTPDGSFTARYVPTQPGRYRLTYQGIVRLPDGTPRTVGRDDLSFDVYPATLLRPQVVQPTTNTFEATNILGLPTGLIYMVQLVDSAGQPVVPVQAVDGDPNQVFTLRVTDSQQRDRSSELVLVPTTQPGVFRAEGKTLGPDEYTIQILPTARLRSNFVWADRAWSYTYKGTFHPGFFVLLVFVGLLALDVLQWGAHWLLTLPHPFRVRGTLVIAESREGPGGSEYFEAWKRPLPQSNRVRYANGWVWQTLVPWRRQDFPPRLNIRRLEAYSVNEQEAREGIVTVNIKTTKGRNHLFKLRKGGLEDAREIDYGFKVYLR
jgi:hypothetical protein